jgi:transcription-repair coupling factor
MVSCEEAVWGLRRFFRWYRNNVLTSSPDKVGTLSPEGLAIHLLSMVEEGEEFTVIASPDEATANKLYTVSYVLCPGLSFFLPGQVPVGGGVPGFLTENQRYAEEALSVFTSENRCGLLFTTTEILGRVTSPDNRESACEIFVRVGKKLKMRSVLSFLEEMEYHQTEKVINPLFYSVRGGIIDVFLVHSRNPVRLEFFGDMIESIRLFNPFSQRTIKEVDQISLLPRFLEKNNTGQSMLSSILSDDSIKMYQTEDDGSNKYSLIHNNKKDRLGSLVESEHISSNHFDDVFHDNKKFNCFAFSEQINKCQLPSFIPENQNVCWVSGTIENGFYLKNHDLMVLGLKDLPGSRLEAKSRWIIDEDPVGRHTEILDISDLEWGEPLVHEDFGIGVYRGLENTGAEECIKLKYSGGGAVYVPVAGFNKLHRLVGVARGSVAVSTLGSGSWVKKKKTAKKHAENIAKDLLETYASRQQPRDFIYDKGGDYYRAVCESFPFNETEGQRTTLQDVVSDMESAVPMERLVCGDVGFGKTEIALRASVKAVENGKMVFVLAPTTVLADQHYFSFTKRLSPLGINVEILSRFRTKVEQKKILENIAEGCVDILIGTHRLISDDVPVDSLGLIVIDEEHRFGVKHKEKIKSVKSLVDVLTLTATPIPRTLKQSLVGLKNISIINTPPKSRRPIKTFVNYFDWKKVFRVIEREVKRGGQVYFVHNKIETLSFFAEKIQKQFSNIKIKAVHGRLHGRTLEAVMLGFFKNEIDVLCCTTIVGSGLDVSNANTIIVNNAHHFGLSQLYQLRGRVGRSVRQAFCYLLIPKGSKPEGAAFQRLKALEQNTKLGSGYKVALKDLDIRGAGDLFGTKQSGAIGSVGFHMYNKILKDVIDKERCAKKEIFIPKISIDFPSGLSKDYVPLVEDRLYFYQSLALSASMKKINDIEEEILDRFGPLPTGASFLLSVTRLRASMSNTSVRKVYIRKKSVELTIKSFIPFDSVETLFTAVTKGFNVKEKSIVLKNKKDGNLLIMIGDLSVTCSSIKSIICSLEKLFKNKKIH